MPAPSSRGKSHELALRDHLKAFQRGPTPERERPVIWDVTSGGCLVNDLSTDSFLEQAGRVLVASGRVYRWEDTVVYEFGAPPDQRLLVLAAHGEPSKHAASYLTNVLSVGVRSENGTTESVLPAKLAGALLASEGVWQRLPAIRWYSRRAVFDADFTLCGPGWHPDQGILVHGTDIVPSELPPVVASGPSIDRLPPCTRRLLRDFCFATDADLENALALLITGLLSHHFITDPKPLGLIDGNQQEIGKTLLCQVLGQVLDGREPERIPLVKDEELEKKVGAKLRESKSTIFFFDNIKTKVESAFIEANAPSPVLSVRLLGHSRDITRPNTYLFLITSNLTSGSSDMITRGVPVRLRYEGDPVARSFHDNPLHYAARHRPAILGELAGMVLRWKAAGRPSAAGAWPAGQRPPRHRWQAWADVVGGILAVNGFTNFLGNVEEAKQAMDEGLQSLAALAEHIVARNMQDFLNPPTSGPDRGRLPREWTPVFGAARVCQDKLAEKTVRGRDTWVGTYLSGKTDRPVSITVGQQSGLAVLRRNPVRSDQKRYYFEVTTPTALPTPIAPAVPTGGTPPAAETPASPPTTPAPTPDHVAPPETVTGQPHPPGEQPGGIDLEWV
jgi:hypothetical protein